MLGLLKYPYPGYVPNSTVSICVSVLVGISLIAWVIQSIQVRFQPRRLSILLLISHLMICAELILRATLNVNDQDSQMMFGIISGLFATGQRMIIVSNFSFVLEIHHEKTRLARGIFLGVVLCIILSGSFLIPANMFAFDNETVHQSLAYRTTSASILLAIVLLFFVVLHWSDTLQDMTQQGFILIAISSSLCVVIAIFNLIESISKENYDQYNRGEGWFYGFNIGPIIFIHFIWTFLHPKRSLTMHRSSKTINRYTNAQDDISI